ncbi:MAG TPA: CBS domain-containing protein [Acidimicrobiales bacterium]|nr:CBS domain-containing protein [Acidimicrobiales bacterium]
MAFIYPEYRYYYDWYAAEALTPHPRASDGEIKAAVVARLRNNLFTKDCDLRVDVKRGVVILAGVVPSRLAKRSAGDDCWDTLGVTDVSNQLAVDDAPSDDNGPQPVADVMTADVVRIDEAEPLQAAAAAMRDSDIGAVVVMANGAIAGIVTDRDLVVRAVAKGCDLRSTSVGAACTEPVVTVRPDESVELALRLMRDHAVRRIVVVDGERPVGIVSLGDVARRRDPGSVLAEVVSAPAEV